MEARTRFRDMQHSSADGRKILAAELKPDAAACTVRPHSIPSAARRRRFQSRYRRA